MDHLCDLHHHIAQLSECLIKDTVQYLTEGLQYVIDMVCLQVVSPKQMASARNWWGSRNERSALEVSGHVPGIPLLSATLIPKTIHLLCSLGLFQTSLVKQI